jgi:hypothetical protein
MKGKKVQMFASFSVEAGWNIEILSGTIDKKIKHTLSSLITLLYYSYISQA